MGRAAGGRSDGPVDGEPERSWGGAIRAVWGWPKGSQTGWAAAGGKPEATIKARIGVRKKPGEGEKARPDCRERPEADKS